MKKLLHKRFFLINLIIIAITISAILIITSLLVNRPDHVQKSQTETQNINLNTTKPQPAIRANELQPSINWHERSDIGGQQ